MASARKTDPATGETFNSVLKPIGKPFSNKTVNFHTGEVTDITIEPTTEKEIQETVAVMGGDDWEAWIEALRAAEVLSEDVTTISFSYIGSEITKAVYRDGSIGRAKDHLEATALKLNDQLKTNGGRAYVVVSKGLVTQSSSAIPIVPLYISSLYKIMKEKGIHEGCIEQTYRLFKDRLYAGGEPQVDEAGRIRIDDWELREDVQAEVVNIWDQVTSDNIYDLTDLEGYRKEFFQLFGFETEGVDYEADVNPDVKVPNSI